MENFLGVGWLKGPSGQGHETQVMVLPRLFPLQKVYNLLVHKGLVFLEDASMQAIEAWSKLCEAKKATETLLGTLLTSCFSAWIQSQQVRHDSAELSASALQNKMGWFGDTSVASSDTSVGMMSLTFLWSGETRFSVSPRLMIVARLWSTRDALERCSMNLTLTLTNLY